MKSLITEPLGLFGWKKLEPVILASLVTKFPLLLIGKHGCAKSFILERLAESLNLEYRFYNASLINYDDLVGIPIPDKEYKSLKYITNKTSIWDCEVCFIDEINRCKPDLQNKLFPIIYDKRIQGINLDKLKYRFAAINPPYSDNEDEEDYIGAMPLDKALADRFPFIIEVPTYDELNEDEIEHLLKDQYKGKHNLNIDINELINKTEEKYKEIIINYEDKIIEYLKNLVPLLKQAFNYISLRRITMIESVILSIHASRIILNEYCGCNEEIELLDSCILGVSSSIPNIVNEKISKIKLISIATEAYRITNLDNITEKKLLLKQSGIDKLIMAIKNQNNLDKQVLSDAILSSIGTLNEKEKRAAAMVSYLSLRKNKDIPPTTIETLIELSKESFKVKMQSLNVRLEIKKIADYIIELTDGVKDTNLKNNLSNLLNSFLPNGYKDKEEVKELYDFYTNLWSEING